MLAFFGEQGRFLASTELDSKQTTLLVQAGFRWTGFSLSSCSI